MGRFLILRARFMRSNVIYSILTHPLFIFPLFLIMLLAGNGSVPLLDQDEAAYALMATEMLESGDYLTQKGIFTTIHKKPPMHIWLTAAGIKIFGNGEFGVRFFNSIIAWLTLIIIYLYGSRLFHERVAIISTILVGCCLLFPVYGKIAFTDGGLFFCSTWAGFSIMSFMNSRNWAHVLTFWIAIALGILFKGPPILIFGGLFGILVLLLHPVRWRALRLHPWIFLPLALCPLLYWGYSYWQLDDGKDILWMIDWYIFKRAGGENVIHNQTGPPGYYFVVFALAFLPFFRFFLPGIWEGIKAFKNRKKTPELLLLGIWMVSGWLVYEFIPSKLPSYAYASVPAFAMLMAHEMVTMSDLKVFSTGLKALSVLEILMVLMIPILIWIYGPEVTDPFTTKLAVGATSILVFASVSSFVLQLRKKFLLSSYVHLLSVGIFWLVFTIVVYPKMGQYWSGPRNMAEFVQENENGESEEVLLSWFEGFPPSIPYYLKTKTEMEPRLIVNWYDTFSAYNKDTAVVSINSVSDRDTLEQYLPPNAYNTLDYIPLDRMSGNEGLHVLINEAAKKKEK